MKAQEKTILTYIKEDGSAPFSDRLEVFRDRKARAIIRTRITSKDILARLQEARK